MAIIGPGITIGSGITFGDVSPTNFLYAFTNFTFTTGNLVGSTSGNLIQFKANYSNIGNTWIDSTSYYNVVTRGYQIWTVPQTGTYEIEAAGSRSGNVQPAANTFASGAIIRARINLTQGSNLTIAVGQPSANVTQVTTYASAGGGGGTWVVQGNTALIVAGGAGGVGFWSSNVPTYRAAGNGVTTSWGGNSFNGAPGGTLGQGGSSHVNLLGTISQNGYDGGGGGGWISNGVNGAGGNVRTNATNNNTGGGGQGWLANLIGGVNSTTYPAPGTSPGGFGGGGGPGPITGGGGGGYSGGGGAYVGSSTAEDSAGGGGSYIISSATNVATSDGNYNASATFGGSSITNIGTFNGNPGYVKITFIG